MANLTHFVKQDWTERTRTTSTATEETNYTVNWSDLTGAGFANGDTVAIICLMRLGSSNVSGHTKTKLSRGSTYAGATDLTSSGMATESAYASSGSGHQFIFASETTLATNDNIYITSYTTSSYTNRIDDFTIFIFKTADLGSTNYKFNAVAVGSNAPTTPTDGATVTLGAGDWLIFAFSYWQGDDVTADQNLTTLVGGTEVQHVVTEGEDVDEALNLGSMVYCASVADSTIAKVQYWTDEASTQDITSTRIMAIRLNAFKDYWGVHATNTYTHSVLDTYTEVCGNGSYTPTVTGYVLAFCFPHHTFGQASHAPYGRIQVGGSDWPASGANRTSVVANGPSAAQQGPILAGYASLTASTAYDFDFDCAEDYDISPTYDCDQQDAVIFSVALASTGTSVSATKQSLTLTKKNATVKVDKNVNAGVDTMALTKYNATVKLNVNVSATKQSLAISQKNATVKVDENVNVGVDALALATYDATINVAVGVSAGVDALILAGYAANVGLGIDVQATLDSMALTAYDATVKVDENVNAGVDALALATYDATVNAKVSFTAGVDAMALTAYGATVKVDENVNAGVDALALTEYQASINVELNVQAGIDALALVEFGATVDVGEGADVEVSATVDAMTLATYDAGVNVGINVSAGLDSMALTENAANVNAKIAVSAGVDPMTLSGYAATINAEINVSAGFDAMTLAENAAGINAAINVMANTDAMVISGYAANINAGVKVQAAVDAMVLSALAAQVGFPTVVLAQVVNLSLTELNASVDISFGVDADFDSLILYPRKAAVAYNIPGPSKPRRGLLLRVYP